MTPFESKNEKAWRALFSQWEILQTIDSNGFFEISADQIREYREPRLMTKFDNQSALPELFRKNHLSILPISRSGYIISKAKVYHSFERESNESIRQCTLPEYLHSLDAENITSESVALNTALAAEIIADFMEEHHPQLTLSGRMGSDFFHFHADLGKGRHRRFDVKNSQIEIDAAYEGCQSLAIFEAKNYVAEDFLIRQLYYPYRLWQDKLLKPVRPIFLTYSNAIFTLREYTFRDRYCLNSIELCKQRRYALEPTNIGIGEIEKLVHESIVNNEPFGIPFPQADSFARVIDLCEKLQQHALDKEDIIQEYGFDKRQVDYYVNAGRYLGFLEKGSYQVTEKCRRILKMNYKNRQMAYCQSILAHPIFRVTTRQALDTRKIPPKETIITNMQAMNLGITGDTLKRRASTVRAWVEWILSLSSGILSMDGTKGATP